MDPETIAVHEHEGARYARRRGVEHPERARAFAASLPDGALRLDLGCGPGHHLPLLGSPAVAVDAAHAMVTAARTLAPSTPAVQAELGRLPFPTRSLTGIWASKAHQHLPADALPAAFAELHRILRIGGRIELTMFAPVPGTVVGEHGFLEERSDPGSGDDLPGRLFTWWDPDRLREVLEAAAFDIETLEVTALATASRAPADPARTRTGDRTAPAAGRHPQIHVRAIAARRLPDHVRSGLRLLVCGLNPSRHAADDGIGYVSPSNRFWPAMRAAGLTDRDRDPAHLLRHHRIGMTDLVRRATPRASDLTTAEYRSGLERLRRLCDRYRPGALVVVGLAGWRAAVDRNATPGWQPEPLGATPVHLMPSTSGLNAGTRLDALVDHLRTAADGP